MISYIRRLVVFLLAAAVVLAVSNEYKVVHGWPALPEGFAFGQIPGLALDSHGDIFVFNRGEPPVLRLEAATGKILDSWGGSQFSMPHGLRVDHQDNVWLTDALLHQVYKFSHDGKLLMTLGEKSVVGVDKDHFNMPTDVAVAPDGTLFVADGYGNNRVVKFSADGKFLAEWGVKGTKPGEFDTPHGLVLDSKGLLYVADRGNSRIQVFDSNGKFLKAWSSEELGRPWGLTIGPDGFLWVVDGGDLTRNPKERNRVLKLTLDGKIVSRWGSFGSYDGQFYWAHAIAVAKTGEVYVGDVDNGMRVQKFVPALSHAMTP